MQDGSDDGANEIFYMFPQNGDSSKGKSAFDKSKKIAAKYLVLNGARVVDPVAGGSDKVGFYTKLKPDGTIDQSIRFQNTKNYLVVPANYTPAEAEAFADEVNSMGFLRGTDDMRTNFWLGGEQDIQRSEKWGVPKGETAPAFKDAASWHLGFVTEQTNIPKIFTEIGGGILNVGEFARHPFTHALPTGSYGMDPADEKNFYAGIEAARSLSASHQSQLRKDALVIGADVYRSIAPIASSFSHASAPGGAEIYENGGDPSLLDHYYVAHDLAASYGAATHAGSDAFHQIGKQAFDELGLYNPASGGTSLEAAFSIAPDHSMHIDSSAQAAVHQPGYGTHATAPILKPSGVSAGGMRHLPFVYGEELPSIAPIKSQPHGNGSKQKPTQMHHTLATPESNAKARQHEAKLATQAQVRRAVHSILEQQARLPPSGPTAFDPRLTPAWAGLKLPQ